VPATRYAKSGGVHIAYQVVGAGPIDLVVVPGWVSHVEDLWEHRDSARFFERLASFSRLILFDKRGTGLSDRVGESQLPTLEQRMDDVRAVMEAVGSTRAALFGISEGGPMSFLFAATYPERTVAVVAYASYAKWIRDVDYPWAPTRERHDEVAAIYERRWGEPLAVGTFAPSMRHDEAFRQRWARMLRAAASPAAAVALYRMNIEIDIRHVLPAVRVPTLLLHRTGDRVMEVGSSRYIAQQISGAKLVELPGDDHLYWLGDWEAIVGEIEEFLTGVRHVAESDRVLAAVLFTDIVGSTARAAAIGDTRWRDLLADHHGLMRQELARFRGREIDTAGDGFFATFDGPARAIRCASAAVARVQQLGLEVRAGLHTGECERIGDRFGGIAVHIGARVAGLAAPGEVLVSSTVKDLVAGSGLRFVDRGTYGLKGVPGEWKLFSVVRE
jgi:class 3 adenylate cyclase/pimeloyl-ACP methyl ester carboxylesterase